MDIIDKRNNKLFWITILLFIIIILFLLSLYISFGKIEGSNFIPTGNVDVFDIDVNCNCKPSDKSKKCVTTDSQGNKIVIPSFYEGGNNNSDNNENNDDQEATDEGKVYVDDKNGNYLYHKKLNIFNNSAFEYKNKIAPGTSNTYNFTVHNSTKLKLKYYIEMKEKTSYKINLKYRLKRNNNYVIGNSNSWVDASKLKTEFSKLNAQTSDKYSLDWKWEYEDGKDKQDTSIGENMDDIYKLNIRIYFEQVGE